METIAQVKQTTDYSIFRDLVGNRNINKLHVKRLKDSFSRAYLLSPIIVNDKFEIIDGQHRFEAARESRLPINFIIVPHYGLREVQMLNENMKNWSKLDYLNAYCDLGYPEYLKFRNFMRRFTYFGINASEVLLTDKSASYEKRVDKELISDTNKRGDYVVRYFQEGDLVIPNYDRSVENAEKIMMLKQYYDGFSRVVFVRAMIGLFKNDDYNHSQLLQKLQVNPNSLQHCSNVMQYKLLIEDIYNFRSRNKVNLRF